MRTSKAYLCVRHGSRLTAAAFTGRMTHFAQSGAGIIGRLNQATAKISKKTAQIFFVYPICTKFAGGKMVIVICHKGNWFTPAVRGRLPAVLNCGGVKLPAVFTLRMTNTHPKQTPTQRFSFIRFSQWFSPQTSGRLKVTVARHIAQLLACGFDSCDLHRIVNF